MRTILNCSFALAVAVAWGLPAVAAEKLVPEEGAVEVMLLRQKSVRKELKLTDDEAKKIDEFTEKQWTKAREIAKLSEEERDKKFADMTKENERFIDETLTKQQRERLNQITLQLAGLLWVKRAHVASELGLTEEQKQLAPRLQKEARTEVEEALQATSAEERKEKMRELRETSRKRLMSLLTEKQKAKWREMTGAPFQGEIEFQASAPGATNR